MEHRNKLKDINYFKIKLSKIKKNQQIQQTRSFTCLARGMNLVNINLTLDINKLIS